MGSDSVASFSVADDQGREKPTIWWNCALWGKRAQSLAQYLTKGQQVTVSGNVTQRTYIDKEGIERTVSEIRVNDVALQGGKRDEAPARAPAPAPARKPAAAPAGGSGFDDMSDDVPFMDPLKRRGYHLAV